MHGSLLHRLQVVAWFVVAAVCFSPVIAMTQPYWGLYEACTNDSPPRVHTVDPGSPAAMDGFRVGDELLSIDGRPVHGRLLGPELADTEPGRVAVVRVLRNGSEVEVHAATVRPRPAAFYYLTHFHPAFGGLAAGTGMFLSLSRLPGPRGRGAIGLALALAFAGWHLVNAVWPVIFFWRRWMLAQQYVLSGGETWDLSWLGVVASLVAAGTAGMKLVGRVPDPAVPDTNGG